MGERRRNHSEFGTCHSGGKKLLHVLQLHPPDSVWLADASLCLFVFAFAFTFIPLSGFLAALLGSLRSVCRWRWPCNFTQKHQHQVRAAGTLFFLRLFPLFARRFVYFGINVNFNLLRKYFVTQVKGEGGLAPDSMWQDKTRGCCSLICLQNMWQIAPNTEAQKSKKMD